MRVLLFTGKGGVGKTTAAAGTATLGAIRGLRTLVLSTDAAHSLGDAFDLPVGREPDARRHEPLSCSRSTRSGASSGPGARSRPICFRFSTPSGSTRSPPRSSRCCPGPRRCWPCLEVRDQAASGRWDLVVVDCAPTAETLRLLALPEALGWYMDRVLPVERRLVKVLEADADPRGRRADAPGLRVRRHAAAARRSRRGTRPAHRLVAPRCDWFSPRRRSSSPRPAARSPPCRSTATASTGSSQTGSSRPLTPMPGVASGWPPRRRSSAEVEASFAPIDVWRSPYRACEPVGLAELAAFAAELYGRDDPFRLPQRCRPDRVRRVDGRVELRVALPFAQRGDIDLARRGDELVVTVGSYRRLLALPAAPAEHARCPEQSSAGSASLVVTYGSSVMSGAEPVGTLAEEAAKLFAAVHVWAAGPSRLWCRVRQHEPTGHPPKGTQAHRGRVSVVPIVPAGHGWRRPRARTSVSTCPRRRSRSHWRSRGCSTTPQRPRRRETPLEKIDLTEE